MAEGHNIKSFNVLPQRRLFDISNWNYKYTCTSQFILCLKWIWILWPLMWQYYLNFSRRSTNHCLVGAYAQLKNISVVFERAKINFSLVNQYHWEKLYERKLFSINQSAHVTQDCTTIEHAVTLNSEVFRM